MKLVYGSLLAVAWITLTGTAHAASTWHSDPAPTVSAGPSGTWILHKELTGYGNYGTADSAADVLYTGEGDSWTFNPSMLGFRILSASELRLSLALDDHYTKSASDYVGQIRINGTTVFNGGLSTLGVVHGAPYNNPYSNW